MTPRARPDRPLLRAAGGIRGGSAAADVAGRRQRAL